MCRKGVPLPPGFWDTKDKGIVFFSDMDNNHLENVLQFIQKRRSYKSQHATYLVSFIQGELKYRRMIAGEKDLALPCYYDEWMETRKRFAFK